MEALWSALVLILVVIAVVFVGATIWGRRWEEKESARALRGVTTISVSGPEPDVAILAAWLRRNLNVKAELDAEENGRARRVLVLRAPEGGNRELDIKERRAV